MTRIDLYALLAEEFGDRYVCLNCGHECTTAAACERNAYGHQRVGFPCAKCIPEWLRAYDPTVGEYDATRRCKP